MRWIVGLIMVMLAFLIWQMPTVDDVMLGGISNADRTLNSLPDCDYKMVAELWREKNQHETAMAILEYVVENDLPDRPAAELLYEEYLREIKFRNSALGRLSAFGKGATLGTVNSWEELSGSCLADFFIYGDLRDLGRELIFEDNADEFIVILSALGIATTVWPPADPAASLLKAAKKTEALSGPLQKRLIKVASDLKTAPDKAGSGRRFVEEVTPLWDLSKRCKTWSQYKLFLSQVNDSAQAKRLIQIMDLQAGNPKKLEQVLAVAQAENGLSRRMLDYVNKRGQQGMDNLYAVLRKGTAGLKFIADHPTLVARTLKNTRKSQVWGFTVMQDKWQALLVQLGWWMEVLRWTLFLLFTAVALFALIPFRFFANCCGLWRGGKDGTNCLSLTRLSYVKWLTTGACIVILFAILARYAGKWTEPLSTAVSADPGSTGVSQQLIERPGIGSFLLVAAFFLCHVSVWSMAKRKALAIENSESSCQSKLAQLDNADVYFDLPLYIGLFGTVLSFLVMAITPIGGRLVAYFSTAFGLISAALLRTQFLVPLKERIMGVAQAADARQEQTS